MKVTAIFPDPLIREIQSTSGGKNITDSLLIALKEWLALKRIQNLNRSIKKNPLIFQKGFSAEKTREINRTRK